MRSGPVSIVIGVDRSIAEFDLEYTILDIHCPDPRRPGRTLHRSDAITLEPDRSFALPPIPFFLNDVVPGYRYTLTDAGWVDEYFGGSGEDVVAAFDDGIPSDLCNATKILIVGYLEGYESGNPLDGYEYDEIFEVTGWRKLA